jgi:hypothetical protein
MPYAQKPKKADTLQRTKEAVKGWDFFPESTRTKLVRRVASAIDAYHRLSRPDPTARTAAEDAGLPALPRRPVRGRRPNAETDQLVGRIANIYARARGEPPTRPWDDGQSAFEQIIEDVFRVSGIRESASAAVARHIDRRNKLKEEKNKKKTNFYK